MESSNAEVRLVFAGEILGGFQADEVKRRFGEAFKVEGARLAAMFSGERTVLKRALSREDAVRYVMKLQKMGVRVHVEPLTAPVPAPSPSPAAPAAAKPAGPQPLTLQPMATPPAAAAPAAAAAEEEIVCPNCSTRQSKRVFCKECTTDMPRGIAAKKEDADRARAERRAERFSPPKAEIGGAAYEATDEPPPLLGLGFSGRMGRITYFNAGMASMGCVALAGIVAAVLVPMTRSMLMLIPFGLLALAFVVWAVRASALRMHDMNRSGWWAVLTLIPYLGSVVSLVMMFWPGTEGENDYGEQPRQGNGLVAVVIGVLMVIIMISSLVSYNRYVKNMRHASREGSEQQTQVDPRMAQQVAEYLESPAARDAFAAYAREPSHKAFAASDDGAFGWRSGQVSARQAATAAMAVCEEHRKPYTKPCELVNVNGIWAGEQQR